MAEFQNTIDLLGDDVVAKYIVERTISEFNDDVITKLKMCALGSQGSSEINREIKSVRLPNLTEIGQFAFDYCYGLEFLDMGRVGKVPTFYWCNALKTIIIRTPTVCQLSSTNNLNDTRFGAGKPGGTAYVPQALITEYQNATNWSTLYAAGTCNFVAIEGSEYE